MGSIVHTGRFIVHYTPTSSDLDPHVWVFHVRDPSSGA